MRLLDPAYVEGVFAAARNLSPREVEALEQMGIPADTLAGPTPVRVSCGHFEGEGFAFDHHGPPREDPTHVYIFLITNPWHEAIDIVACSPSLNKSAASLGRAGRSAKRASIERAWPITEPCPCTARRSAG